MPADIALDLQSAFNASIFGAALCKPFPIGTIHRASFPTVQAWCQKFHPEIKRRKPKHRKRK